ncbi:hypothetical protein Dsin_002704 [Dipteronia sinensis]|uniref:Uncharacterized protein n=1 Tax=Dipteronia sinensis TaxID=43782 RepID=A0AAE0B7L0_9ROSI|nr:hypothetical protein Dsin_002704 [Dipteronia sinensis]
MIRLITSEEDIPIHIFEADGSAIYTDKINGHFIWDVDPSMCDADCDCRRSSRQHCTSCKTDRRSHSPEDPDSTWIGLLPISKQPLPIYDRALQILRTEGLLPQIPSQSIPCFMASSYDQDFLFIEPTSNPEKTRFSRPYVQSTEILPDGSLKHPSHAEQLNADLYYYINLGYHGSKFDKKEREIRQLKAQLEQLKKDQAYSRLPPISPGKYPLLDATSKSKPRSSKASVSRKDKGTASSSAQYKPALYSSLQTAPSSAAESDSASISSTRSNSSTESHFHLSSASDVPDLTQAFMASIAEPSTRTYESPDKGSTCLTPIVEEPPDTSPMPTCLFHFTHDNFLLDFQYEFYASIFRILLYDTTGNKPREWTVSHPIYII